MCCFCINPSFVEAKKIYKPNVSKLIVGALRSSNPPSRFLRLNEETSRWEDVGDKRATEKVSQALREKGRDSKAGGIKNKSAIADPNSGSNETTKDRNEDNDDDNDDSNVIQSPCPTTEETGDTMQESTEVDENDFREGKNEQSPDMASATSQTQSGLL